MAPVSHDFDEPVDRRGTSSVKHDQDHPDHPGGDLLRLWVADMDFRAPEAVTAAIRTRADHGVFGYTEASGRLASSASGWVAAHDGWTPDPSTLVTGPGVVFLIAQAVRALTAPGDPVLIQPPVYYPFSQTVRSNGRALVRAPLSYDPERARAGFVAAVAGEDPGPSPYTFDAAAFEGAVVSSSARMFILCNPHNPVGRVWTSEELDVMARVCAEHGVFVVADEIHADFGRPGHPHAPFAAAAERAGCRHLVCTSPSKTFNMAGLQLACGWVPDADVRSRIEAEMDACGYFGVNPLSQEAAVACFEHGAPWLADLKSYLEGTLAWVNRFVARELPGLCVVQPEGTYLLWLDCRGLGLPDDALARLVEVDAGLWVDPGTMFGPEGSGFIRINLATQRFVVQDAFRHLRDAVRA